MGEGSQGRQGDRRQELGRDRELCGQGAGHVRRWRGLEFRKLLTESGFGDHPEMIRMFRKIGEKLGEDKPSNPAIGREVDQAGSVRTLYPNDPKEEAKQ
jgi:hypothetical protein